MKVEKKPRPSVYDYHLTCTPTEKTILANLVKEGLEAYRQKARNFRSPNEYPAEIVSFAICGSVTDYPMEVVTVSVSRDGRYVSNELRQILDGLGVYYG